MSAFKTPLRMELIDTRGNSGSGIWRIIDPLVYQSDHLRGTPGNEDGWVIVPPGFVTDLASVPRFFIAYAIVGNINHEGGVVHDWLYSAACKDTVSRVQADYLLAEIGILTGTPAWKANAMWAAVRTFGARYWKAH